MKYEIVIFTNHFDRYNSMQDPFSRTLGTGILNSGVFEDRLTFDSQVNITLYRMDSEEAKRANIQRDPTAGIGFMAPDGTVKIAYLYDKNSISESRVSQAVKTLNDGLVSEGGGWTPRGGYQGGFPGGTTSLISLEGAGLKLFNLIPWWVWVALGYFAYKNLR